MSHRSITVCDLCQREERLGVPTAETVPQVINVTLHIHTRGSAFSLDVCRECAEKTSVYDCWQHIVDEVKKHNDREREAVTPFVKGSL